VYAPYTRPPDVRGPNPNHRNPRRRFAPVGCSPVENKADAHAPYYWPDCAASCLYRNSEMCRKTDSQIFRPIRRYATRLEFSDLDS